MTSALGRIFDEDILVSGQQSFTMLCERMESLYEEKSSQMMAYLQATADAFPKMSRRGQAESIKFFKRMIQANKLDEAALVEMSLGKFTGL